MKEDYQDDVDPPSWDNDDLPPIPTEWERWQESFNRWAEDWARWLRLFGLFVIFLAYFIVWEGYQAHGTWKPEYALNSPAVRDWYERAMLTPQAQTRFPFKSCCAQSEVVRTKFKVNKVNGQDVWLWLDGNTWRVIPPDIIHYDQHAPDGQPTLFVYEGKETCFFVPEGGI